MCTKNKLEKILFENIIIKRNTVNKEIILEDINTRYNFINLLVLLFLKHPSNNK